jgi:ABC-type Fe3+/spermidine/putrescine transport system ATPase subunit
MAMSDLIAVMRDRRIEQISLPETVYRDQAITFLAGFLGLANLVPVEVASTKSGILAVAARGLHSTLPLGRVT